LLNELKGLYESLENLKKKREDKDQKIKISMRIKEILESLLDDLDFFA
jgi:hypothetical protein